MARLIFVDDSLPGITRRRLRDKWVYVDPSGSSITDEAEIARLNVIALPPAYVDAWYAPAEIAHILATGFDAKGRKQYRYHPEFRLERESLKFDGCAQFGRLLPLIRARVADDLHGSVLSQERAIASIVRLLDGGAIRIGNESYAKSNKSFGATTLRMRHADLSGGTLHLRFKAKSGKQCEMRVTDKGLVRFVRKMQELPGQHLFQFLADDGSPTPVSSTDVNCYLSETMGGEFSAKDFRTWAASTLAFAAIASAPEPLTIKQLTNTVAEHLGNTPAVARKSYIHPALIDLASGGGQAEFREGLQLPRSTRWLSRHERGLIDYLEAAPSSMELLSAA